MSNVSFSQKTRLSDIVASMICQKMPASQAYEVIKFGLLYPEVGAYAESWIAATGLDREIVEYAMWNRLDVYPENNEDDPILTDEELIRIFSCNHVNFDFTQAQALRLVLQYKTDQSLYWLTHIARIALDHEFTFLLFILHIELANLVAPKFAN